MTDPTGRSFLSYRRTHLEEAQLLLATLHERGVPTWQDVANLNEGPLGDNLRAVLRDPFLASGVLWLTQDVPDSVAIRTIEIPELLRRAGQDNAFFVLPVAADGLSYEMAGRIASTAATAEDLRGWDMEKVESTPLSYADASKVARRVIERRLTAICQRLAGVDPLRINLYTRGGVSINSGTALVLDWTHRFNGRVCAIEDWQQRLLGSVRDAAA